MCVYVSDLHPKYDLTKTQKVGESQVKRGLSVMPCLSRGEGGVARVEGIRFLRRGNWGGFFVPLAGSDSVASSVWVAITQCQASMYANSTSSSSTSSQLHLLLLHLQPVWKAPSFQQQQQQQHKHRRRRHQQQQQHRRQTVIVVCGECGSSVVASVPRTFRLS